MPWPDLGLARSLAALPSGLLSAQQAFAPFTIPSIPRSLEAPHSPRRSRAITSIVRAAGRAAVERTEVRRRRSGSAQHDALRDAAQPVLHPGDFRFCRPVLNRPRRLRAAPCYSPRLISRGSGRAYGGVPTSLMPRSSAVFPCASPTSGPQSGRRLGALDRQPGIRSQPSFRSLSCASCCPTTTATLLPA